MYGIRIGIRRRNISMVEVFKDFYSRNGMVSVKSFINPTGWGVGGGGSNFTPPSWFSLNNLETVKAVTVEFCSI